MSTINEVKAQIGALLTEFEKFNADFRDPATPEVRKGLFFFMFRARGGGGRSNNGLLILKLLLYRPNLALLIRYDEGRTNPRISMKRFLIYL